MSLTPSLVPIPTVRTNSEDEDEDEDDRRKAGPVIQKVPDITCKSLAFRLIFMIVHALMMRTY